VLLVAPREQMRRKAVPTNWGRAWSAHIRGPDVAGSASPDVIARHGPCDHRDRSVRSLHRGLV